MSRTLPDFPSPQEPWLETPVLLRRSGVRLRPAQRQDVDFLRGLYRSLRADELAQLPWPEPAKQFFLDDQFALQHIHFVHHYRDAEFLLLEQDGAPIGRFYLLRRPQADFHVVEIALLSAWRGQGFGAALIRAVQQEAGRVMRALTLHVDPRNLAARRLYERLQFEPVEDDGPYQLMRWQAAPLS